MFVKFLAVITDKTLSTLHTHTCSGSDLFWTSSAKQLTSCSVTDVDVKWSTNACESMMSSSSVMILCLPDEDNDPTTGRVLMPLHALSRVTHNSTPTKHLLPKRPYKNDSTKCALH